MRDVWKIRPAVFQTATYSCGSVNSLRIEWMNDEWNECNEDDDEDDDDDDDDEDEDEAKDEDEIND